MMAGHQNYPPSFKQGFARCAAESEYPQFWDRLYGAWAPALGITGSTLLNFGHAKANGVLAGATWASGCLAFSGGSQWATTGIGSLARTLGGTGFVSTSVLLRFVPRIAASRQVFLADWTSGGSLESCVLENNQSGADYTKLIGGLYRLSSPMSSVDSMRLNAWNVGILTADPAASRSTMYLNGVWQASDAVLSFPGSGDQSLTLGRAGAYNGLYYDGLEDVLLIAAREWSRAEVAMLSADPLAPFRLRRTIFASASRRPSAVYRRVLASAYGVSP
jgi:hypothetical protein